VCEKSDHFDIMFRFTCHCGAVNAPIVEIRDFEATGTESVTCPNCKRYFSVNWNLSVEAEMDMKSDPEVEATIWDDISDDDDDDEGEEGGL
jgi:hypothetical protein